VFCYVLQAELGGTGDGIIEEYYTLSEWASSINTPLLAQAFRYENRFTELTICTKTRTSAFTVDTTPYS
jgi:hypothetical protein